jgi:2-isopropylmalate synthase
MRQIFVSDQTLFSPAAREAGFRQKLEAARKLDHLGVSAVETPKLTQDDADMLLMRSLCSTVKRSVLSCETGWTPEGVERAWSAVKGAAHPRLTVSLPLTSAQLEYVCHMKPPKALEAVSKLVAAAKEKCADVEFVCEDATRAERPYAMDIIRAAVAAGAGRVTLCDSAGVFLPDEMATLVKEAKEAAGDGVVLAVRCGNDLQLSLSCSVSALLAGADEVKTAFLWNGAAQPGAVAQLLRSRGADLQMESTLDVTRVNRTADEISQILSQPEGRKTPFDGHAWADGAEALLPAQASDEVLSAAVKALGYELGEEDMLHVKEAVQRESKGKGLTRAELEALILSSSRQVPPTYRLKSYLVNSGNTISPSAHVALDKDGDILSGLCAGDGPIDAAFLAIEQIIGGHYELDDFQISTITQNRASMGDALVRLRHNGKIYAGKGISTDIIGAAIRAYLNALNKIAYEEKTV